MSVAVDESRRPVDAPLASVIELVTDVFMKPRRRRLLRKHVELTADQVADLRVMQVADVVRLSGDGSYPEFHAELWGRRVL